MKILLASAKIMNGSTNTAIPFFSEPLFSKEAEEVALELSSKSPEELARLLHCSAQIAGENHQRYQSFFNESEQLPAILAYYGQAYKYLKAEQLTEEDLRFAQDHLLITSFLYGLLRPLDRIHPYRLEAKVKLNINGNRSMFDFWKTRLTDVLIREVKADDGILVHLATEEYEHLFDWKRVKAELHVVHPYFMQDKGDQLKMVTVHAKSCRGAMARYIIEKRIDTVEDLQDFTALGYVWRKTSPRDETGEQGCLFVG